MPFVDARWHFLQLQPMVFPAAASALPPHSKQQSNFEIRFMANMIAHHSMAVMMAQMCLEKVQHSETQAVVPEHHRFPVGPEPDDAEWAVAVVRRCHSPQPSNAKMQKLMKLSGGQFEIELMEELIEHHADAIRESRCLLKAYHKELRHLCQTSSPRRRPKLIQCGPGAPVVRPV